MNGTSLRRLLDEALLTLEASREELRDLDAAIGDGDLGITVTEGAKAARAGLSELPDTATPAEVLRTIAQRFASANPSTMAALVAAALLAGSRALADSDELDRAAALTLLERATQTIADRGKAEIGDKTILDALVPTIDALRSSDEDQPALPAMIAAAQRGIDATTGVQSKRGRAAWVGERTIGHPDGGATAYLRLLQALGQARQRVVD